MRRFRHPSCPLWICHAFSMRAKRLLCSFTILIFIQEIGSPKTYDQLACPWFEICHIWHIWHIVNIIEEESWIKYYYGDRHIQLLTNSACVQNLWTYSSKSPKAVWLLRISACVQCCYSASNWKPDIRQLSHSVWCKFPHFILNEFNGSLNMQTC